MLAYNKTGLSNRLVRLQARKAAGRDIISSAENQKIIHAYTDDFYSPNVFMRIGLGLVTLLATWAIGIMFLAVINPKSVVPYYLISAAVIFLVLLELLISRYHHYRSGLDDVLLYSAILFLYLGLVTSKLTAIRDFHLILSSVMTLAGIMATLRYADTVATVQGYLSGIFLLGALWNKWGTMAFTTMPIVIIIAAGFIFFLSRRSRRNPALLHYRHCLMALEVLSLCTMYIAGNYRIDDVWWISTSGLPLSTHAFKYASVAITALFPLWCLLSGIQQHDLVRIRLAVLMAAGSLITFHYYAGVMPDDLVMMIYGAFMILIAYFLVRKLRKGVAGYTYEAKEDSSSWIELEELVAGGTFSARKNK